MVIASHFPGRSNQDVRNRWNTAAILKARVDASDNDFNLNLKNRTMTKWTKQEDKQVVELQSLHENRYACN